MGLLSSITSALGTVGNIVSPLSSAFNLYSSLSGSAQKAQAAANQQNVELSNTAYQRAMADMKAAGLNPILAGKLGGASTPNIISEFTQVPQVMQASAAQQQANTAQAQMEANVEKISYEVNKLLADIGLSFAQQAQVRMLTKQASETINKIKAETGYTNAKAAVPKVIESIIKESGITEGAGALSGGLKDIFLNYVLGD